MRGLRDLSAGEFYAFGPAFKHNGIERTMIGKVKTTHERSFKDRAKIKPVETPKNIKKILKNVIDLPKEAEEELRTISEHKKKIVELKTKLTLAKRSQKTMRVSDTPMGISQWMDYGKKYKYWDFFEKKINQAAGLQWEKIVKDKNTIINLLNKGIVIIGKNLDGINEMIKKRGISPDLPKNWMTPSNLEPYHKDPLRVHPLKLVKMPPMHFAKDPTINSKVMQPGAIISAEDTGEVKLGKCEKNIYSFLAMNPTRFFTKIQVSAVTGYSPKSGGFNNAISRLNFFGLIQKEGGQLSISGDIISEYILEGEEFSADPRYWEGKLGACERKIYQFLWDHKHEVQVFSKEHVAEVTVYSPTSGGFNNAISRLNSIGLIKKERGGLMFNPELLEL